ncbi:MAG: cytochrome b/b6 domain-containing protein [Afipia sp.]|nr:cytochrome b/b6 domain-containing protein [Afipia sp.]MBS4001850.1 cytochrome b/b6 domain-containing protein [Afipia sp.]
MIVIPVSGYLFSGAGGYSLPFFGLFSWTRIVPRDDILSKLGQTVHDWGAWAVYAMLLIHVAAVAVHEVFTPHSALARMLPGWKRRSTP